METTLHRRISAFARAARGGRVPLVALGVLFALMASVSPASAICYSAGKPCGINAAFNDRLCCPGTLCGWGGVCQSGCRINGQFYRPGAVNPQNRCQKCDPSASMTSWTGTLCVSPVQFLWQDISGTGTPIILADDQVSGAVPLGFTFRYFGTDYTDVYVSSNGFLTVLPGQYNGCCTGQPTPGAANPNGVIAGWWEDLYPPSGGSITYETLGSAPNRVFIVQFEAIQHFFAGTPTWFQFKIFEGTNVIEVHYRHAASDGGTHSAGIENQSGTQGVQYFLGTASLTPMTAVGYITP